MNRPPADEHVFLPANLRRLISFQVKLALDALRDFALSPVSIVAFIIDSIRRPPPEQSLYHRLMLLGRRSDEVINLFDQHSEHDHYTVDKTLKGVEHGVGQAISQRRAAGNKATDTGAEPPQTDQ